MDHLKNLNELYAVAGAQSLLLNQLYTSYFAADPEARERIPAALLEAGLYLGQTPNGTADDEIMIDIQARAVLYMNTFFSEVEGRLRREESVKGDA